MLCVIVCIRSELGQNILIKEKNKIKFTHHLQRSLRTEHYVFQDGVALADNGKLRGVYLHLIYRSYKVV